MATLETTPRQLLRFATIGSVDDGKSTLIGRLLYDAKGLFDDQVDAVAATTQRRGQEGLDLSLVTDGLRAEREQGITIDVAYRYFATPSRSFIIGDNPGHAQYTRNMATGASTADLAVVLVDARTGLLEQTRRHLAVAATLGIRHLVLAVNKMDLVDWSEDVFDGVVADVSAYVARLGVDDLTCDPGLGAARRQHRRSVDDVRVVRGPDLARAPRARRGHDDRRRRHRSAGRGAARHPHDARRPSGPSVRRDRHGRAAAAR